MVAARQMTPETKELLCCALRPAYFIQKYCQIYDSETGAWIHFDLWPGQVDALHLFHTEQLVAALKARQLGLSWLALAYALWQMLFDSIATVLIFSRRDDESAYLLGEERLRGMYHRLPSWMKSKYVTIDNVKTWALSNGSVARAFPTTAGDGYTATLAIVDEADLVPNLRQMLLSIKPTIDAGGKLFLISRIDKSRSETMFRDIYKAGSKKQNNYKTIFLPWYTRPGRTQAWYEAEKQSVLSSTGSLDDLYANYPATEEEALKPREENKRIPSDWILRNYQPETAQTPDDVAGAPGIPHLMIFRAPERHINYVVGVDPAEGNPNSDDSALTVLNVKTGEEVASLSGKFEPSTMASYTAQVAAWYNRAHVLVERNNHGHAVILWLRDNSQSRIVKGEDNKDGWHSTTKGKTLMYSYTADAFKDDETVVHRQTTYEQLCSIEGSTLRAPGDNLDDLSDSYALAVTAIQLRAASSLGFMQAQAIR